MITVNSKNLLAGLALVLCLVVAGRIATAEEAAPHDSPVESETAAEAEASGDPLGDLLFPSEPDYNLPPVQPKLGTFLWSLILFSGFVLLMGGTVWRPLIRGINSREARVITAERDAEAARREVEKLRAESDARLAEVQDQVKALIAQARTEAEAEKRTIVANAEAEAQRIKDEALQAISEAYDSAVQNLDQTVDEQVALATEHVAGRRL